MSRSVLSVQSESLPSASLKREVKIDFFFPVQNSDQPPALLLINDGQNMEEMGLQSILEELYARKAIMPILCVAIHAGEKRKREYGVAAEADYMDRGDLAADYTEFILEELLPFIHRRIRLDEFKYVGFAGFSLGGVSALDIVWNHPQVFQVAGVFSGSLWWRSLPQEDPAYHDHQHRIMHNHIRKGEYKPGLRFYLQCGNMDEAKDRNHNGIIDSIDDTIDLMKELEAKGYRLGNNIHYREMVDGKHDIATWGRAFPEFLQWAFSF